MGSELFTALKLQKQDIERGGGESMVAPPEAFAIIGVDTTAENLTALYPEEDSKAHARARAIIAGIRDKTRTAKPPPAAFVATLRCGVRQAITLANLGPDRKGRIWIVVALGRQRTLGLRLWNAANPEQTHRLRGMLEPFAHNAKAGVDAELEALEANAASNVFVAMPESGKADHATMLAAKGKPIADIAITIGARDAEHVGLLLELAKCEPCVQDAIDSGKVAIGMAAIYSALAPEEQDRRLKRATAKGGKKGKSEAAPARAKTRPAPILASIERTVRASLATPIVDPSVKDTDLLLLGYVEALRVAQGGDPPAWAKKFHDAEEDERKAARKKGGGK